MGRLLSFIVSPLYHCVKAGLCFLLRIMQSLPWQYQFVNEPRAWTNLLKYPHLLQSEAGEVRKRRLRPGHPVRSRNRCRPSECSRSRNSGEPVRSSYVLIDTYIHKPRYKGTSSSPNPGKSLKGLSVPDSLSGAATGAGPPPNVPAPGTPASQWGRGKPGSESSASSGTERGRRCFVGIS